MFPVLINIGSISIPSLGVFLALGFFYSIFLVWRLARAWDFNEEKVLDITLVTTFGAIVFSRLYFVLEYLEYFGQNFTKIFLIFKYPGFSFWGAFLGGWLTLYFTVRKFKLDFAVVADIASVGLLGILVFGDIGCFFGGCGVGTPYNGIFAVNMVGQVNTRFPVQILEAALLAIQLAKIWPKAIHFHSSGSVASKVFIYIGLIKFLTEFLRVSSSGGHIFPLILILLGVTIHYRFGRNDFRKDLKERLMNSKMFFTNNQYRKDSIQNTYKSWYTSMRSELQSVKIASQWKFRNFSKFLRKINVKSTPKNY